jgi:RNA-directed DNA polymerase
MYSYELPNLPKQATGRFSCRSPLARSSGFMRLNCAQSIILCANSNGFRSGFIAGCCGPSAERHLHVALLVTLDVKQCFPSITCAHVYRVWSDFLGCSPPVSQLLTQLTTFKRHLPQGAATSPLLANLLIWMIDEPIRRTCDELSVVYSTWIDDLAFSGGMARALIQPAVSVLAAHGLRVGRHKIRIMGPNEIKLLTGTRLGSAGIRAPKDKLSRLRSGIHKFRTGLVRPEEAEKYILGLVGQLRFIHQLCPGDASRYAGKLSEACGGSWLDRPSRKFLASL